MESKVSRLWMAHANVRRRLDSTNAIFIAGRSSLRRTQDGVAKQSYAS